MMARIRRAAPLFCAFALACGKSSGPAGGEGAVATASNSALGLATAVAPTSAPSASAAEAPPPADTAAPAENETADSPTRIPPAPNGILPANASDTLIRVDAKPKVRVFERGAEPRARLAYDLVTGATDHLSMSLAIKLGILSNGKDVAPKAVPKLSVLFDVTPKEKSGGRWHLEVKVAKLDADAAGADPRLAAASVRSQMQDVEGTRVSSWVTPSGELQDLKLDTTSSTQAAAAGSTVADSMVQSMHSLVVPLPSEPIGIGGKWEVLSRVASGGADLLQIATYTLKSRAGTKATLDTQLTQYAAKSELAVPGATEVNGRIRSIKSNATGTTDIDLKSAAPLSATTHLASTMDVETKDENGQAQHAVVSSDMRLEFSRSGGKTGASDAKP